MDNLIIPKDYHSELNLHDTQIAIKTVKDFFQGLLALRLNLSRVSAPLFVDPLSGLNDNLNGVERPVTFDIKEQNGRTAEVVQSLAKWKRYALKKYGFSYGEGLYTDMNAIRRDEITDNIHSIFVDQWDWEKVIKQEERTLDTLKETVNTVYKCLRKTEKYMAIQYDYIEEILPHDIFFRHDGRACGDVPGQHAEGARILYHQDQRRRVHLKDRRYAGKRRAARRTRAGLRRLGVKRRHSCILSGT